MKIIHEESVYLIPEDNNIVVLAGSEQKRHNRLFYKSIR